MSEEATGEGQFNIMQVMENVIRVIDHAADQGAFKGWDTIQQVLGVRAQVEALVNAFEGVLSEQASAEATETAEATDVAPAAE